ncbi:hypothetical protein CL619_01065 [archaeon]|nr:hypothetical protein [archaeon]|tara:strand:- start:40 stop:1005 length:966 start_codon:yes stop_codon:yes gene_type:complete
MQIKRDPNQAFYLWLSSVLLYGLGLLFVRFGPHYSWFVSAPVQEILFWMYLGFVVLSIPYYVMTATRYSTNKSFLFFRFLFKNISSLRQGKFSSVENEEKVAVLFTGVKLFFLPLMLQFLYQNYNDLLGVLSSPWSYGFFLILLFTIDTAIFAFGYTFEFAFLKNTVRSVEPTFFGWLVCLLCYPPFNWRLGDVIPWGANDYMYFWNPTLDIICKVLVIVLLLGYTLASVWLGPKASNLTNRGIVTSGPYAIIRHPAYICKNGIWWLTLLPVMSWPFFFGMLFWSVLYYYRALTEERHLGEDADYVEYCRQVKWRFVPFVW